MARDCVREALYAFADTRERLAQEKRKPDPILKHDRFIMSPNANDLIFQLMVDDFTRELINSINGFYIRIFDADCWTRVSSQFDEDDRSSLLYEFAKPLFELCLSSPYSLKNRFIYSTANLLHQSNRHVITDWKDDLPKERDISYKTLEKLGKPWTRFADFLTALATLNDDKFRRDTRNYRHLNHHRFPIHIGRGLLPYFVRAQAPAASTGGDLHCGVSHQGGVMYEYHASPPLDPGRILKLLYSQHASARKTFEFYWLLLEEQLARWQESKR